MKYKVKVDLLLTKVNERESNKPLQQFERFQDAALRCRFTL
jgi:translation initiation factor 2 alpha subunit (eIF-2alpha)